MSEIKEPNKTESELMIWRRSCFFTRLIAVCVQASEKAGREVKKIVTSKELGVVSKGKNDLQTAADRISQQCIVSSLRYIFSKEMTIIGEEGEIEVKDTSLVENDFNVDVLAVDENCPQDLREIDEEDIVVWVDPLDGTAEFTQGVLDGMTARVVLHFPLECLELLEQVTILVGVGLRGRPIAGVIHQPFYGINGTSPSELPGRTVWGAEGLGAHALKLVEPEAEKKVIVTTRSHGSPLINETLESLKSLNLMTELVRVGGAGFKVLCALEKGAHAYVFPTPGTKKWDTCAPEAVLRELGTGGQMTDVFGTELQYSSHEEYKNNSGVIATPKAISHQKYLDAIPAAVKEKLVPKQ